MINTINAIQKSKNLLKKYLNSIFYSQLIRVRDTHYYKKQ